MARIRHIAASLLLLLAVAPAAAKVTFDDHVRPIFQNRCFSCHNPDKLKAGLDLTSYETSMAGSSGGAVLETGSLENSILYLVVSHQEEPAMPPKQDKLSDDQLTLIRTWIEGGLLKTAASKAIEKKKPAFDMALGAAVTGKPQVLPPMPAHLLLEPVVVARRSAALAALAANPWNPLVAVSGQKQVLLYDSATFEPAGILPFPEGQVQTLAFSRNGRLLLAGGGRGGAAGRVVVWNVQDGRRVIEVGHQLDAVIAADIRSDQRQIALGGADKLVKVFATADGEILHTHKKHTDWVTSIAFSPDGVLLASGDRNGGLLVFEAESGGEFHALGGHGAAITGLSWRDDSNVLASASEDGTIRLWEMFDGKQVKNWKAHGGGVSSVHFGHDARLVSSGRDKHVRVWNQEGKQQLAFAPFDDIALRAVFTHDDRHVVAGDWQGQIRVWKVEDGAQVASLSGNPPRLAQRLEEAEKLVALFEPKAVEAREALTKATTDAAGPRAALAQANAAAAAAAARHKTADEAAQKSKQAFDAAAKALEGAVGQLGSAKKNAEAMAAAAQTVASNHEQIMGRLGLARQRVEATAKLTGRLADAAKDARSEHEKDPDNESLSEAAASVTKAVESAAKALSAAQVTEAGKTDESTRMAEQMKAARLVSEKAAEAAKQALGDVTQREAAVQSAAEKLASATKLMQGAQGEKQAADKQVTQMTEPAKAADARVAEAGQSDLEASAALEAARQKAATWRAAQINVKVIAARQHAEELQAEHDRLALVTGPAQSRYDAATAAMVATADAMKRGPQTIKQKEDALLKANQEVEASEAQLRGAEEVVAQKRAFIEEVDGTSKRIAQQSDKDSGNEKLAQASIKANESVAMLREDLKTAQIVVADRTKAQEATRQNAVATTEVLEKTKAQVAGLPEELKNRRVETEAVKAELDKATATQQRAAEAVAEARGIFEKIEAEYLAALPRPAEAKKQGG
jgi:hypothetical protein